MSSLRNAVQRRNHRERAQPEERKRWGLLEKSKDYKLRAADHKLKRRKINALKQKASERNEDEFYFGMMSSTTVKGVKRSTRSEGNSGGGGEVLSQDVVKLMKTQDQGYLHTMLQRTIRERERVEREVVMGETGVDGAPRGGKIVFGDREDEFAGPVPVKAAGKIDLDLDLEEDDSEDGASSEDEDDTLTPEQREARKRKRHTLDVRRRKLEALREQEQTLTTALRKLDDQRAKMSNTIGGVNKNGVKFKQRTAEAMNLSRMARGNLETSVY